MSGDYSRERFDPRMHLSGLLQQQGRVHYDGDANELMRILGRRARAQTADAIGRAAVPRETPGGFEISVAGGTLTIGCGRIYVDGLLAENHGKAPLEFDSVLEEARGAGAIAYAEQPYSPNAAAADPAPTDAGTHLVYLVVWEREATYLQLPELVESAIGDDTVAALQTVWQVRVLNNVAGVTCATPEASIPGWNDLVRPSAGRLTTKVVAVPDDIDACVLPASGGYRGLENQLYRIEIHDGGAPGTATFKWSRDNATVATNVLAISGVELTVVRTGRDNVLRFNPNDTVEITDDDREFAGKPGEIRRVKRVTDTVIELDSALPAGFTEADGSVKSSRHTRIRRWDSDGLVTVPPAGAPVTIERGVQAVLTVDPARGSFKTADYWTFAARTADASVEMLDNAPPRGIHRHYCRLAVVKFPDNTVENCRTLWPPLPAAAAGAAADVIRVRRVDFEGERMLNDASVPVRTFAGGIRISCDAPIDPESIVGKPACIVTLELPFPFNRADLDLWTEPLVAFAPLVLNARLTVEPENVINWRPERDTAEWLVGRLFQRMRDFHRGERVLAHLTLKGNFIWGRERRNDRLVYLDGDTFGTPRDGRTDVIFGSGEGTRGGDFRMWCWLIPDAA